MNSTATTSRKKTTHSTNQGQKKTRSSEAMPAGARALVVNQMPTPVSAPAPVMRMTAGLSSQ
jgi:hypothetical protein